MNPISLGIFFLMVSIVLSSLLGRTALVEKMAKQSYFSSRDFQDTIVELTLYLKQAKLDVLNETAKDNIKTNPTFENMKNLTYVMTGNNQVVTNDVLNSVSTLRKNSETYYHITFMDTLRPAVTSNMTMDKATDGSNDPYITGQLIQMISGGLVGEANENKNYKDYYDLEAYYFMGNGPLVEGDFIYTNIKNQEDIERMKLAIYVHLAMLGLWAVIVFIGAIQSKLQSGIWVCFRKIPFEIKGLGALIAVIVAFNTYYWLLWQNSFLYTCLYTNLLTYIRLGTTLVMCVASWYIVDLVAIIRKDYKLKSIFGKYFKKKGYPSEDIMSKDFQKELCSKSLSKIYSKVGIDIRKSYQFKVVLYNLIHIAVLWGYGIWTGHYYHYAEQHRFVIVLISMALIMELFILYKFQQLTNMVGTIKETKPHVQIMKKVIFMMLRLTLYGGVLYIILNGSLAHIIIQMSNYYYTTLILTKVHVITLTLLGLAVMFWTLKVVEDYRKLYLYVVEMAQGKEVLSPPKSFLGPITDELMKIDNNYKEAIQQELKSQRMKTELISNVSHDLKTPLTSIINYIDLLKKDNLTEEEAQEYINILDQKSQRLKVLIEDLFEASKTASGNLDLMKEKLELVSLLKQTLSELEEKIEVSTLQFKLHMPEEKVYCLLDGRRTYRIFENLINNILKYSAPHSRVYINCELEKDIVSVIFRNTSAHEMTFTKEEIIERFKRGDKSRHTEGSGLGLAIAKNLIELQGGTFEIVIDGDLFKAIVTFPTEVK